MRRIKQIWFLSGTAASLIFIVDIFTTRLGSGGSYWYIVAFLLLGAAIGSFNAATSRQRIDRFHVNQIWFFVGAVVSALLAMEARSKMPVIGIFGGYLVALALLGSAFGSMASALKRRRINAELH
ncbi:MAG TPA: hypothetical protein VMU68_11740 [Acidimicrobiales bacterium]|nr:hypothetical protein [Acidimicrobiales bacterium]